ncbi:methyl-accepting chemotaxis protein [Sesbania bispinosa]|nr:methyl-accepting chemotaxis protein [Sesbania bispinosa]
MAGGCALNGAVGKRVVKLVERGAPSILGVTKARWWAGITQRNDGVESYRRCVVMVMVVSGMVAVEGAHGRAGTVQGVENEGGNKSANQIFPVVLILTES